MSGNCISKNGNRSRKGTQRGGAATKRISPQRRGELRVFLCELCLLCSAPLMNEQSISFRRRPDNSERTKTIVLGVSAVNFLFPHSVLQRRQRTQRKSRQESEKRGVS